MMHRGHWDQESEYGTLTRDEVTLLSDAMLRGLERVGRDEFTKDDLRSVLLWAHGLRFVRYSSSWHWRARLTLCRIPMGIPRKSYSAKRTNKMTAKITVGPIPHQIAFTPDHKYALAIVQATGQLAIIDAASHQIVKDVAVGHFPHWVGLTSDGTLAYVTNEGDNIVSVVDMAKQQVVATILVGDGPRKIALPRGAGAMSAYLPPSTPPAGHGFAARAPQPVVARAGDIQIRMATFAFGPATVTVRAGQRVTWIDGDPVPHTATAKNGGWDSGQVVPGGSFTVAMTKPGTYEYFCGNHPFMQAKVIVTK
jgi:YVTN family beta-propeller protein